MLKDRFGRPENSINFGNPNFTAVEWDKTSTENVVYLRGDYEDVCIIQKVDNAQGKITWARGAWASRTTLEYGTDRLI